jgi:predicted transcriptional regulator
MDHVAIMKKSWHLIDKILAGEKIVESRWYKNKSTPWNQIKIGETIYFKDSGSLVTAKAIVKNIEQFENLNQEKIQEIFKKYPHEKLGTIEIKQEIIDYTKGKKYCIIVSLTKPELVNPFDIDKK